VRVLIADDDPISLRVLSASLRKWGHEVVATQDGYEAWRTLKEEGAPLIAILDWMMPGLDGVEICRKVRNEIVDSEVYIILLTAMRQKENLIEGLEAGADDYLTKPFDKHELRVRVQAGKRIVELQQRLRTQVRDLEQAIVERKRAEEALRNLSLTDHLTGLHNHRGFYTLVEHQLKATRRHKQNSLLIYADMDGLKQINDTLGHQVGSDAITAFAEILKLTFRDGDIVARVGGDEFAILAPNVPIGDGDRLLDRLRDNIDLFNREDHPYKLAASLGVVPIHHNSIMTLEEYMANADHAMYENKRQKRAAAQVELKEISPTVMESTPAVVHNKML
jgi:diguanylate cyclase (GGDEF)-like protein